MNRSIVRRKFGGLTCAVALLLIAGLLRPGLSYAYFDTCRSDPTVTLSNGVTVQMEANIRDTVSDIQRVDYVLHGPIGTSVSSVVYDTSGVRESVVYLADQRENRYRVEALALTASDPHIMTVHANIFGSECDGESTRWQNGQTGTTLVLWLGC